MYYRPTCLSVRNVSNIRLFVCCAGEYTFPNILSGLDDLCSGPVVIQINEGILTSAFALNASLLADRRVETFGNPDRFWSSIILPKRYGGG